eukprot:m51a1_g1112 putative lipopolysaccharide-induced tumor necrosis factor-alpha factor homolog (481) ;mRNA; r:146997-149170
MPPPAKLAFGEPVAPPPAYVACVAPPAAIAAPNGQTFKFLDVQARITCQFCGQVVTTETRFENGSFMWVAAGGLFFVGLWPCCLIPFCVDSVKDVRHSGSVEFSNGTVMFAIADSSGVTVVREGRSFHDWRMRRTPLAPGAVVVDVALSERVAVVGASSESNRTGSVSVVNAASGSIVTTLQSATSNDGFGRAVAVDCSGHTAVIGAPLKGYASVLVAGATWGTYTTELVSSPASASRAGSLFAHAVATSTGRDWHRVVVGSPFASASGGAVYVYERNATSGTLYLASELRGDAASIGAGSTSFGHVLRLSCDGNTLVVGAPCASDAPCVGAEAGAYVFHRKGASWSLAARYYGPGRLFGAALALDCDPVEGAQHVAVGEPSGHVHVMHVGESSRIDVHHGGAAASVFGASVSLRGDVLAVGAPNSNAVYMFSVHALAEELVAGVLAAVLVLVLGAVSGLLVCYKLHPSTHLALSNAARV